MIVLLSFFFNWLDIDYTANIPDLFFDYIGENNTGDERGNIGEEQGNVDNEQDNNNDCDELPRRRAANKTEWGCGAMITASECSRNGSWWSQCCTWNDEICVEINKGLNKLFIIKYLSNALVNA